jgi:hypothetical protein
MTHPSFRLRNRDEVAVFERHLDEYVAARAGVALRHISLLETYDRLHGTRDASRIFAALLDLQTQIAFLHIDLHSIGRIWNEEFAPGLCEGLSLLESPGKFFGKADLHRTNSSYVLRYRAIWDKIMGLLVLLLLPAQYNRFIGAKSRKRMFRQLAASMPLLPPTLVDQIESTITRFDDQFRTSEAHGTGVIRKWNYLLEAPENNPQLRLFQFWNVLNHMVIIVGDIIRRTHPIPREPEFSPA